MSLFRPYQLLRATTKVARNGSLSRNEIRNKESCVVVVVVRNYQSLPSSSGSGSGGGFSDYLGALRLRAANALTSSMPVEEQRTLLEKLGGIEDKNNTQDNQDRVNNNDYNDDDDDVNNKATTYQHSIEEAIAVAKAKEAQRYEEKWEREKEALIAEAEEAARRRIQHDLDIQRRQIAFEAWKKNLEKEKEGMKNRDTQSSNTNMDSSQQQKEEALGEHPILGPVVADLGYKRIHTVSSRALAAVPVWKKQRIYRHGRAKVMAGDKLKSLHLGLPGIIGIYESSDGSLKIIDGQHRIGMLKVLEERAAADGFDFDKILVEVYPQNDHQDEEAHAKELFLEVNKAEPVKLVDLPGVAKASDRKVINEGADRLHGRYPDMFSESQRCRPPHLNIDNLRDALFASNVIQRHSLKTPKALEQWMLGQNEMLASKFRSEENRKLLSETALKKAEKYDFYLGLDSSWLYN
jgi:hypothetical protein